MKAMRDLGNKEVLAKNLQYYMDSLGVDRKTICNTLGISYTTFSSWLNGTNYPRIGMIEKLSIYFGILKSDLIESHTVPLYHRTNAVRIPILKNVVAGITNDENAYEWIEISEKLARSGDYYALFVQERDMEPRICEGDVVIIKAQDHCENGNTVLVSIGSNEPTIKKVKILDDGIMFIANNVDLYSPHFYNNKEIQELPVKILGVAVELRGHLL